MKLVQNFNSSATLRGFVLIGSVCLSITNPAALAATLYWDLSTSGTTAGAGGATPTGIWSGGVANWSLDPAGTSATQVYANGSDAVFSAGTDATGSFTATVNFPRIANSITFQEGTTVSISGSNSGSTTPSLSILGGGIAVTGPATNVNLNSSAVIALGAAQSWTNTGSGTITVNGGLAIDNQLTLSSGIVNFTTATNTGMGGVRINGAAVATTQAGAFGMGALQLTTGSIRAGTSADVTIVNPLLLDGGMAFNPSTSGSRHLIFTGGGSISGSPTLTFSDTSGPGTQFTTTAITLNGDVTFAGAGKATFGSTIGEDATPRGITKAGTGTVFLNGANTYTGITTVSGGALNVGTNAIGLPAVSNLTLSGGVLETNGTFARSLGSAAGGVQWTAAGGGFAAVGGGLTVALSGGAQINWNAAGPFGGDVLILGSVNADSKVTLTNGISLNASRTIQVNSGVGGDSAELSGVLLHGSGAITKTGTGLLILSGANTYGGATIISGGTLEISHNTALGDTTGSTTISPSAGRLALSGGISVAENITINGRDSGILLQNVNGTNSLTGTLTWTTGGTAYGVRSDAGKLTINGAVNPAGGSKTLNVSGAGDVVFSGALANTASGTFSVTKADAGKLTLSGTNTYTGNTTINAGTLLLTGSVASSVTVNNTGTLGGNGTIAGTLTVNNGGTLAAGNSPGVLTAGATTLNSGSIFSWDLDTAAAQTRGTGYDGLVTPTVSGDGGTGAIFAVVLQGSQTFTDTFWATSRTWSNIFTSDGAGLVPVSWASVFSSFSYANENGALTTPSASTIGSFSMTGNTLTWSAVPEPDTALAGFLIGAGLLCRNRRPQRIGGVTRL